MFSQNQIGDNRTKSNRIIRVIATIFAVILLVLLFIPEASASTQGQINQLREQKAEYERQRREISERIDTIEFERMAEIEKKEVLDERITLTVMELEHTNEIINQYNILITEKEYEIIIAQNRESEQLLKYRNRVRAMEENGMVSFLEIIFNSTSFSDFLARIDFVNDIMRADEQAYNALRRMQATTVAAKEDLEDTKAELDEESIKMESLKEELEEQLEEAHALILRIEADLEAERELYELVTEEAESIQRQIIAAEAELRRQREAERQRLLAEQQAAGQQGQQQGQSSGGGTAQTTGSGELMWPTSGNVISTYGMRNGRMHYGIDIGAPTGTPVVAADGGTVITSTTGSGYGHYVVVSHGNGMTTLYSHLSVRSVSVGDSVSKGQQVGLVGSTGNATGPHLHFEVSVDGSRVNPMSKL